MSKSDRIESLIQWSKSRKGSKTNSDFIESLLFLRDSGIGTPSQMDDINDAITLLLKSSVPRRQMMNLDRTATNPRDARASSRKEEYDDFSEWERDAFAAGATQIVKLGEGFSALRTKDGNMVRVDAEGYFDPRSRDAIKNRKNRMNIGSWLGDSGTIYRHIIKNHPEFFAYKNPVHSRKPKQRISVSLSKSRKRNPLESGANISDDEDINVQASNMG